MRIVSRWQLGVFAEYISLSRGWEVRAVEWSMGVIGKVECVEYGKVGALISIMGVCVYLYLLLLGFAKRRNKRVISDEGQPGRQSSGYGSAGGR